MGGNKAFDTLLVIPYIPKKNAGSNKIQKLTKVDQRVYLGFFDPQKQAYDLLSNDLAISYPSVKYSHLQNHRTGTQQKSIIYPNLDKNKLYYQGVFLGENIYSPKHTEVMYCLHDFALYLGSMITREGILHEEKYVRMIIECAMSAGLKVLLGLKKRGIQFSLLNNELVNQEKKSVDVDTLRGESGIPSVYCYFQQKKDEIEELDKNLDYCYARLNDLYGSDMMSVYINKLATFAVELYYRQNNELDNFLEENQIIRNDN